MQREMAGKKKIAFQMDRLLFAGGAPVDFFVVRRERGRLERLVAVGAVEAALRTRQTSAADEQTPRTNTAQRKS